MYCKKCGTENAESAQVCVKCGLSFKEINTGAQNAISPYAGFWRRFLAVLIDSVILVIAGIFIGLFIGFFIGIIGATSGMDMMSIQMLAGLVGYVAGLTLNWLYFTIFESSKLKATVGKLALGIVVTDLAGNKISFARANGRYWSKFISALTLLIGYIMAGFTEKKQALHDMIASTLVSKKGA